MNGTTRTSIHAHGPSGRRPAESTRRSIARELDSARQPPCVLLAEDDEHMRRLLANALRRDGFEVMEACNGRELLEAIGSLILYPRDGSPVDLVISDVCMPGATGLEVLAGLRRADWSTPVILITAFGDQDTHAEAKRLGAHLVFDKPFDITELRHAALEIVPGAETCGA